MSIRVKKLLILFVLFLVVVFVYQMIQSNSKMTQICIKKYCVEAKVVSTPISQKIGLVGYKSLQTNQGMWFVFEDSDYHSIWMKNMNFNIDVIFVDKNLKIVDIKENFAACKEKECEVYTPKQIAKYVFEVNAETVLKQNIKIGDLVTVK